METINGYVVIQSLDLTNDLRVIIGARDSVYGSFEYVVATTDRKEKAPTSWISGFYCHDLELAVTQADRIRYAD